MENHKNEHKEKHQEELNLIMSIKTPEHLKVQP